MAKSRNVFGLCDICGFRYRLNQLKKTSYGAMVCPTDYDGAYDLKNHPQNKAPNTRREIFIQNARPDPRTDIQANWESLEENWENKDNNWNMV
jgi:rubredoxin